MQPTPPCPTPLASDWCRHLCCFSAGGVTIGHITCGVYLFIFPPGYVALCGSKAHYRLGSESVSWCLETSLFFKTPFPGWRHYYHSFLFLFLSFLNYFLFLTFTQHSNVLLMNLWGRKWSPRPIPQPSEDCLPNTENLNDLSEKAEIWAQVNWTHEKGNGNPFQYSCLENSMDRGVWWAKVHGLTKSQTWLTNTLTFLTGSSTWQPLVLPF